MATNSVQICNWALTELGAQRISSLTDTSKAGLLCNEQYDKVRKSLLMAHPWNFATIRVELAITTNEPVYEFDSEFLLPTDCLRVWETDLPETEPWVREINNDGDSVLLCNSGEINIRYIKNLTDTTLFSPMFDELLALKIAKNLSYALVQSSTLRDALTRDIKERVGEVRSIDAQENGRQSFEANEWIDIRT